MTCEFEAASHASTRAKSLQVKDTVSPESSTSETSDITLIRTQLEQMSSILKSANYRPGNKSGSKQKVNGKSAQPVNQDARQGLRGPGVSAAGPFTQGR